MKKHEEIYIIYINIFNKYIKIYLIILAPSLVKIPLVLPMQLQVNFFKKIEYFIVLSVGLICDKTYALFTAQ